MAEELHGGVNGAPTVQNVQAAISAQFLGGGYPLASDLMWPNLIGSSSSSGAAQQNDVKAKMFAHVNAFEAIGAGKSFIKHSMLCSSTTSTTLLGLAIDLLHEILPSVRVRGASPLIFEVGTEIVATLHPALHRMVFVC